MEVEFSWQTAAAVYRSSRAQTRLSRYIKRERERRATRVFFSRARNVLNLVRHGAAVDFSLEIRGRGV